MFFFLFKQKTAYEVLISDGSSYVCSSDLALDSLGTDGTVVIGEGERDEAPMLYIGEKVGTGHGPKIDIALDPLEGTSLTAKGGSNALTVIAFANGGCFLNAPDVYMDKIAVGAGLPEGVVDLDYRSEEHKSELQSLM